MKRGIYVLPNAITLVGMFAGFFSIIYSLSGYFVAASWAIMVGMIFDGLDGWVARKTNSTSRFGVELDSLSDVIAFGVAPAVLVYMWNLKLFGRVGIAVAFLYMACGALRLARFNIQMSSSERKFFVGIPIPGAAFVIASMVIFFRDMGWQAGRNFLIPLLVATIAFVMVSPLKFHSIKEIDFSKRKPFWLLVVMVFILAIFLLRPEIALFAFSLVYLASGLVENAYVYFIKPKRK